MSRGPRQGFTGRAAGLAAARPRPDFTRLAGAAAPCPGFKDLIGPGSGFTQARLRLAGACRPRPAFAEAAVKAYGHRRHSLQARARRRSCRGTRPADSPCGLASLVLSQACSSRPARAQRRAIPDCRGCCNGGCQASHASLEAGQWPGPDRSPVTLRTDTGTGKVSLAAVGPALTPAVASPGLNFFESLASPAPQPGSRLRSCISKVGSAYKCNICNI